MSGPVALYRVHSNHASNGEKPEPLLASSSNDRRSKLLNECNECLKTRIVKLHGCAEAKAYVDARPFVLDVNPERGCSSVARLKGDDVAKVVLVAPGLDRCGSRGHPFQQAVKQGNNAFRTLFGWIHDTSSPNSWQYSGDLAPIIKELVSEPLLQLRVFHPDHHCPRCDRERGKRPTDQQARTDTPG